MTDYGLLSIFIVFVFVISLFYFLQLPFLIYALYKRKNIYGFRESMYFEIPMRVFIVIISLIYVVLEGVEDIVSISFLLMLVWGIFTLSQRVTKIPLRNNYYAAKVFYPKNKVEEEIEALVEGTENLQISTSVTGAPISVYYSSQDSEEFNRMIEKVETATSIYEDLNNEKYNKWRILYPTFFVLCVIYIVGIMFVL